MIIWVKLLEFYETNHDRMLSQQGAQLTSKKWVGMYRNPKDTMPKWVASVGYLKEFSLGLVQFSAYFTSTSPKSIVSLQYFTLTKVKLNARHAPPPMAFSI